MADEHNSLTVQFAQFRGGLLRIGCLHVLLLGAALWGAWKTLPIAILQNAPGATVQVILSTSLTGFIGSLLYFSRKTYSYLVSEKLYRTAKDLGLGADTMGAERLKGVTTGYYLYLGTRPLAGFVIGPVLYFCVLGGLLTFGTSPGPGTPVLSVAGICALHVLAFLGGYTSSDLFDYFSTLGRRVSSRIQPP